MFYATQGGVCWQPRIITWVNSLGFYLSCLKWVKDVMTYQSRYSVLIDAYGTTALSYTAENPAGLPKEVTYNRRYRL